MSPTDTGGKDQVRPDAVALPYAVLSLAPRASKEDIGVGQPFWSGTWAKPLTITGVELDTSQAGGVEWNDSSSSNGQRPCQWHAIYRFTPVCWRRGTSRHLARDMPVYAGCAPSSDDYAELIVRQRPAPTRFEPIQRPARTPTSSRIHSR